MKKILTVLLLLMVNIVYAQDITHNISPQEARHLLNSIDKKKSVDVRIDQLLRLALYNILKGGENKSDLDSANMFIAKAKVFNQETQSPGIYGYIALVTSMLQREKGKVKEGKINAESAVADLKNTKDKYHLGLAYLELAQYYDYTDPAQLVEKTHLGEEAVKALIQSNQTELKAFAYKSLADLYSTQSDYPNTLKNIRLSLDAYQSINYKQLQGVYIIYSSAFTLNSDNKNALKYGLLALTTAAAVKDTTMQLCEINNIVAVIFTKLNEPERAISYYKKALQIAEKYNDHPSVLLIASNTIMSYRALRKHKEALAFLKSIPPKFLKTDNPAFSATVSNMYCSLYLPLKLYAQAKNDADNLMRIVALHQDAIADLENVYSTLIKYTTGTGQYKLARAYLLKSDARNKANGYTSKARVAANYSLWSNFYYAIGNYKSAAQYSSKYSLLKDTIYTETKSKQLKQLEVQYETENKIAEIKILNQQNELLNKSNELQQSKLQQAQTTRNWTFAVTSMVLIIAGLLYRQGKIRKKNNVTITQKNDLLQHLLTEKEWLLKEVHHRVKNNLHTVICLLESQARYLENDALEAIETSQHRIYAMSLIHQKLYQSDDIKSIDMATYIPELAKSLEEGFGVSDHIQFQLNIANIT